jgi:small-conductance mechanosensitive channel
VIQTALNDYHISYELTAFTGQPRLLYRLKGDLHQSIQDRFREAGVEIMSPSYLAMRDGNPSTLPEARLENGAEQDGEEGGLRPSRY